MRVLFATSEAYPLLKTGGLADVSGALPRALAGLHLDVRLVLPAYADLLARVESVKEIAAFDDDRYHYRLLETHLPGSRLKVWLVECPELYGRPGNPYHDEHGVDWPDNAQRFGRFGRVVADLALGRIVRSWRADVLHCNDWQTGLAPVYLRDEPERPATVFTIHNLAYQGQFPYEALAELDLPDSLWHYAALEFYGQLAFIKGGLVFADRITTVSPSYAQDIQTPRFGHGLDGLLRHRRSAIRGIVNGIDVREWNPGQDPFLPHPFNRRSLKGKGADKAALQKELGLAVDGEAPLLGFVGRLVHQKGIDLLVAALSRLLVKPLQLAILGSGEKEQERALTTLATQWPERISVTLGYNEGLAHRIEAGADLFLMPSRYEPCGLNQMYSQRYGTIPVVRRVGGLADTVTDANEQSLADGSATGFHIHEESAEALADAMERALAVYENPQRWRQLQLAGMGRDFSWRHSAEQYLSLYQELTGHRPAA